MALLNFHRCTHECFFWCESFFGPKRSAKVHFTMLVVFFCFILKLVPFFYLDVKSPRVWIDEGNAVLNTKSLPFIINVIIWVYSHDFPCFCNLSYFIEFICDICITMV